MCLVYPAILLAAICLSPQEAAWRRRIAGISWRRLVAGCTQAAAAPCLYESTDKQTGWRDVSVRMVPVGPSRPPAAVNGSAERQGRLPNVGKFWGNYSNLLLELAWILIYGGIVATMSKIPKVNAYRDNSGL
jgi:hypothetical protein